MSFSFNRVKQPGHTPLEEFLVRGSRIVVGKTSQLKLALCSVVADGHLLIEDVPGVGKTTLVKFLARALGLAPTRIQCTNDLLPADIIGTTLFDPDTRGFRFHRGPIFGQLVLADELNRATPKTQSALLEVMEERRVTVDGQTHPLPQPFLVVATQNPLEQAGTYPLPESQLDRFLIRLHLGYPDAEAERDLLKGESREQLIAQFHPLMTAEDVLKVQTEAAKTHIADAVIDYIQRILEASRRFDTEMWGLSPRAGLALVRASRAWAYLEGRPMVLPEDVQAVGVAVIAHRLNRKQKLGFEDEQELARQIMATVSID